MRIALAYDRIERNTRSGNAVITSAWEIPVNKEPIMPDSVEASGDGRWHRMRNGRAVTVLETWRIVEVV